ncbi:MAG TPA: transporter substrate-binding domain-containing protein [Gemmatimonadales bacterium]|nr:transporter substrate-binding domain-containing protein [Gemmatimonadales bacterium]
MLQAGWITPRGIGTRIAAAALLALAVPAGAQQKAPPAPASALDRIKSSATIKLGYVENARPFSFKGSAGQADGYAVGLCQGVAESIKSDLGLGSLNVQWVAVSEADQLTALQQGTIDLLCATARETLTSRKQAGFSIPIYPDGIGALIRTDAPTRLRDVLTNRKSSQPNWRASATQLLQTQIFTVVGGTPAASWLDAKMNEFQLTAKVSPTDSYDAAVKMLIDRKANVVFGEVGALLDARQRSSSAGSLVRVERIWTYEPVAIGLGLGNWELRLAVDRALSRIYVSNGFKDLFTKWFGMPDDNTLLYFKWAALPE